MFNGKIHYKWSFSIAMLNYQRVYTYMSTYLSLSICFLHLLQTVALQRAELRLSQTHQIVASSLIKTYAHGFSRWNGYKTVYIYIHTTILFPSKVSLYPQYPHV